MSKREIKEAKEAVAAGVSIPDDLKEKCKDEALQAFSQDLAEDRQEVKSLKKELAHTKLQNKFLTAAVDDLAIQFNDVLTRLENLELNNAKYQVMLTGLYTSTKKG